jgi:hypothetical protein
VNGEAALDAQPGLFARMTTCIANRRTGRTCGSSSGYERFEHPKLVGLMNDLYAHEWSQFTKYFKPTFKLLQREKKDGKTGRVYEKVPQRPYPRLLASADIPEATKSKVRAEHAELDPFASKKSIEEKLRKFSTAVGSLNREATKAMTAPAAGNILP